MEGIKNGTHGRGESEEWKSKKKMKGYKREDMEEEK